MSREANKRPLFTVITCTYNRTKFLDKCLESIETQSFTNFEHLIVDGYSTDGTYERVVKYMRRNHQYDIRVIRRPAKGISNAFNEAIDNANGQFLIFINSDDYLFDSNSLESAAKAIKMHPDLKWLQGLTGFSTKNGVFFLSSRFLLKPMYFIVLSWNCPVSHQACVMHRDVFERYGNFRQELKTHMDTEFFMRIAGKVPIYFTNIKLGMWRIHDESASLKLNPLKMFIIIWKLMYREYRNIPVLSGIIRAIRYRNTLNGIWRI